MMILQIQVQFQDQGHFFRIPGVFQDQRQIQGLSQVRVNPAPLDTEAESQLPVDVVFVKIVKVSDQKRFWINQFLFKSMALILYHLIFLKMMTTSGNL